MTALRYVLASLWQYRRVHLAVAVGVAIATAVITGALLVGDSVRGSLRGLVLERLGAIDQVLIAEQPFRQALATELGSEQAVPLLLLPGTLATTGGGETRRATELSVVGHPPEFWTLGEGSEELQLTDDEVAISRTIATELAAEVGDELLLTLPRTDGMPADSVLGEKSEVSTARRLKLVQILPDLGLSRFSLRPTQQPPRNVFVSLAAVQRTLELEGRANAVAIVGDEANLAPTLDDFNIVVSQPEGKQYVRVTAKRLVLPPALVEACREAFPAAEIQPGVSYLANTIQLGERTIPYSTVAGVDSIAAIGPTADASGEPLTLADDEIVLNSWAADNLQAKPGDEITITYYEPETTHGVLREAEPLTLKLRAVVPLKNADGQPSLAADAKLTPELPGVTDQRSISDWDLPFELVEEIRRVDEDYWDEYSTTPKAFVSYELASRLWSTRWGTDSVLRIPLSEGITPDVIQQQVKPEPEAMGMSLLPVRKQGLAASRGTTAFEGLFLGFSFFLVASALMLIALLFRLGVESRATELGVLATVGWSKGRLRQLWLVEAAVVALAGSLLGVLLGIGYARLMVYGLTHWWVAATVTPFLKLHITSVSLIAGFAIGLVVALLTLTFSLRKLLKLPARQLLTGDCSEAVDTEARSAWNWLPPLLLLFGIGVAAGGVALEGEAQAGAFFGGGALVLSALLTWLGQRLRKPSVSSLANLSLAGLAARNARRYPSRTILSVGLAAVASFLIVALSAFRLAPTEQGTGGFDLIATSALPLHFDLNTPSGREELGFGERQSEQLAESEIFGFRVHAGEDASCLNLYQTAQPEVVAIPESFDSQAAFGWASLQEADDSNASPWARLRMDLGKDENGRSVVPTMLDKSTAIYSLHLGGVGSRLTIQDSFDQPVTLEVVGLLANSVLQGKLLIAESNFLPLFPENSGQSLFLVRTAVGQTAGEEISSLLETQLSDYGFDAADARQKLAGYLAVQNTYLSTFQSLGALGLMLGTFGLAIAQLRSVLQRRGELALLRSTGFPRARLAALVLDENAVLLILGLGIGVIAALVVVMPHYLLQAASAPWATLLGLLGAVLIAGLLAGWLAVRAAVRAPLLGALRGD